MHADGDRTLGFRCDVDCGRVTLSIHERTVSGDGDAPDVTFWRAANAYARASDHAGFPTVDWDEVAAALLEVGVRFD